MSETGHPRYRVQFYTKRHYSTIEWCVCDFQHPRREKEPHFSPIVTDDRDRNRLFASPEEAQKAAGTLNAMSESGTLKGKM